MSVACRITCNQQQHRSSLSERFILLCIESPQKKLKLD